MLAFKARGGAVPSAYQGLIFRSNLVYLTSAMFNQKLILWRFSSLGKSSQKTFTSADCVSTSLVNMLSSFGRKIHIYSQIKTVTTHLPWRHQTPKKHLRYSRRVCIIWTECIAGSGAGGWECVV